MLKRISNRADQQKRNEKLRKRLAAVSEVIEKEGKTAWRQIFIHLNPSYKGNEAFLTNVMAGRSLHEPTIKLLENTFKTNNQPHD